MEVRLVKKEVLKSNDFYNDFLDGNLHSKEEYFTDRFVYIENAPDFVINLENVQENNKKYMFVNVLNIILDNYSDLEKEYKFKSEFWYSLFIVYKREFLFKTYPDIKENINMYHEIILNNFDEDNFIYQCILACDYIKEYKKEEKFLEIAYDNFDLYISMIKSKILNNGYFITNILSIIDEYNFGDLYKNEKLRDKLIVDCTKIYPIKLTPLMDKNELLILLNKSINEFN